MDITERIRKVRALKRFSQEYMAFKLNISQSCYAKIENGKTKLTLERILEISEIFHLDVKLLIDANSVFKLNEYEV